MGPGCFHTSETARCGVDFGMGFFEVDETDNEMI